MSDPILTGVMLEADKPTRNGRIYPRAELERAIAAFEAKGGYGQFYTEAWPRPETPSINLANVSHKVKNLRLTESGSLVGEVEVLKTPMGNVLAELLACGKARFAPSGVGTVGPDGKVTEYTITSVDVVDASQEP